MKSILLALNWVLPFTLGHTIQQGEIGILKRAIDSDISDNGASDQPPGDTTGSSHEREPGQPCTSFWAGTAPFCNPGNCPAGYHDGGRDKRGDGNSCWTGQKRLCICNPGSGPVFCNSFWSGTAPFCRGECPVGYNQVGQSNEGNGGFCISGTKKNCQCTTGTPINPCLPGPIKTSCSSFVLSCNNGCGKYVCGGCLGFTFGQTANSAENRDNSFYQTLLTDQNAPLRQALLDTGAPLPPDASNEIVAGAGVRFMDTVADLLETVDTAASYPQWEDPTTWKYMNGQPVVQPRPADIDVPTAPGNPPGGNDPQQPPNDPGTTPPSNNPGGGGGGGGRPPMEAPPEDPQPI